jgi:hypothetical protein
MFTSIPLNEDLCIQALANSVEKLLKRAVDAGIYTEETRNDMCLNISLGNIHNGKTKDLVVKEI